MKRMFTLSVLTVLFFVKGWAQVPNDNPSGAIELHYGDVYSGNNAGATDDSYSSICSGQVRNVKGYAGVWFSYTATKTTLVNFKVTATTWTPTLQPVVKNRDGSLNICASPGFSGSDIGLVVQAGQSYYIYLSSQVAPPNNTTGSYAISVTYVVNDLCDDATPIAFGQTVSGDNTYATADPTPESLCDNETGGTANYGVWFIYKADVSRPVVFTTVGGASWNTYLHVFSGTCNALTCVGANDDYDGLQSQVTVPTIAGQSYYILLSGVSNNDYGSYSLTATSCTKSVITGISGGGTYCSNTNPPDLSLSVAGDAVDYNWYYNTINSTTGGTLAGSNSSQPILTNLTGTEYYYAVATNACGSDTSATVPVTINAAPASASVAAQQTEICYGSQIQISTTAAGGVKPYTYNYINAGNSSSTGFVSAKTKNEPAGQYYVAVQGANGCVTNTDTVTITQPASPIAVTTTVTAGICGGSGKIKVGATGGYGDFVYTISNSSETGKATPYTFSNLPQGSYTVTAIDAHGCAKIKTVSVGNTNKVPAITGFTGPTTVMAGSLTTYHVDSADNVNYTWTVPSDAVVASGQGTATATIKWGYKSGKIKITPSSSCSSGAAKQYSIVVTHSNSFESNRIRFVKGNETQEGFLVYPNPAKDRATLQFNSGTAKKYSIDVMNVQGEMVLHKDIEAAAGLNQVSLNIKGVANGLYLIRISDGNTVRIGKLIKTD